MFQIEASSFLQCIIGSILSYASIEYIFIHFFFLLMTLITLHFNYSNNCKIMSVEISITIVVIQDDL